MCLLLYHNLFQFFSFRCQSHSWAFIITIFIVNFIDIVVVVHDTDEHFNYTYWTTICRIPSLIVNSLRIMEISLPHFLRAQTVVYFLFYFLFGWKYFDVIISIVKFHSFIHSFSSVQYLWYSIFIVHGDCNNNKKK